MADGRDLLCEVAGIWAPRSLHAAQGGPSSLTNDGGSAGGAAGTGAAHGIAWAIFVVVTIWGAVRLLRGCRLRTHGLHCAQDGLHTLVGTRYQRTVRTERGVQPQQPLLRRKADHEPRTQANGASCARSWACCGGGQPFPGQRRSPWPCSSWPPWCGNKAVTAILDPLPRDEPPPLFCPQTTRAGSLEWSLVRQMDKGCRWGAAECVSERRGQLGLPGALNSGVRARAASRASRPRARIIRQRMVAGGRWQVDAGQQAGVGWCSGALGCL